MEDLRIEKKFVFGKEMSFFLNTYLIKNNFRMLYPSRNINSIYLDTPNFSFLRDNIDGVSKRKKIRFRWYNNDLKNIFFEIKNKRNFLVLKKIKKIEKTIKKDIFNDLRNFLTLGEHNQENYYFILKTSYKRCYWISLDNKIRATVDTNIMANPIHHNNKTVFLPETILEFKFKPDYEKIFRNFITSKNNYGIRAQKYSKYVRSFILLEESGVLRSFYK